MPSIKSIRRTVAGVVYAISLPLATVAHGDDTRDTMARVYSSLATLLPISLDEARFDTKEGTEQMSRALDELAGAADDLSSHAEGVSAEFRSLARTFETNVLLLRQSLDQGRYHEFNYLVLDLTGNCVSCHARLPSGAGPAFAAGLSEAVADRLYSDLDRVQLQIATRQFDAALDTLEGIIADPGVEPLDLELDGVLFDYLTVGITVSGQTDRVKRTLERLRARKDLPYYMARYAGRWSNHLAALEKDIAATPSIARARTLFDTSTSVSPVPSSQERVVHDLVTSTMLRRLLESDALDDAARAEAYWMLGVISIRTVNPRPGVPHTELLLEAAIRAAPGSEVARHSYALLEEYNRVSFAGITNAEMPGAILDLDVLRDLAGVKQNQ